MQHRQGDVPPRRRWRREPVAFTVLGRFAGGDRLGKTVNLSERGLGAVFQGRDYAAEQAVELQLVVGGAVRRAFGVVCFAVPRGRHTRLGIRTFGFIPDEERSEGAWAALPRRTARRAGVGAEPAPDVWAPGAGPALVSPGGLRAMERDRRELAEELRVHHAVRGEEAWEEVLRRFLHELPGSPLRGRFAREQFRVAMSTRYPVTDGTEIHGRVLLHGSGREAQDVAACVIHLDHFAVACADRHGAFVVRGIPPLDDAVRVPLRIANHAVLSTAPVAVHLPRLTTARIEVELAIVLRTGRGGAGRGRVVREVPAVEDLDLDGLRGLVEQL
ncbi:MAG: hypothetical protein P1P84_13155 [Deferrisomatales bacterium]|nr:hypothetical protein [Deferrisomatales bacterium]